MIKPSYLDEETRLIYPDGADCHRDYKVSSNGVSFAAFEDGKITVEKLLDHADLKLDWYIPSRHALKFMVFIRLVLGEEPENDNPKAHYFFVDSIFQSPNVKPFFMARNIDFEHLKSETVVLCSREFSKSTLVTYLLLFMAAEGSIPGFGTINYGLYVSDSMRNGVKKMMGRLKAVYMESLYLQALFEDVGITQEEAVFVRNPRTKKEIEAFEETVTKNKMSKEHVPGRMKRTFKVDGLGCLSSSRGASNALFRPQFVFIDDTVSSEKDASSKIILDMIESTIETDIRGGLSGTGYFIVAIGTPYNKKDPIYRRIEEGLMLPVVFPRALIPPIEGMTKKEFESVWEDRHSFMKCKREYMKALKAKEDGNSGKMRSLMQEHYLRISSAEDRMIPDSMLQEFSRGSIEKNMNQYNVIITTDLTTTCNSQSDYAGIFVWAVNYNMDFFLMDLCLRKMEIEEQYLEILRYSKYYSTLSGKNVTAYIEVDGGQRGHIYAIKQKMVKDANYTLTIGRQRGSSFDSEGIMSRLEGGNKHWRFRMILPMFQNKKLWFPIDLRGNADYEELVEELKFTTYESFASRDDGNDCVSQLGMAEISYPPKPQVHNNLNGGSEEAFLNRMLNQSDTYQGSRSSYT